MPISESNGAISFLRLTISPAEIPRILDKLDDLDKKRKLRMIAADCEKLGIDLINSGFDADKSLIFVDTICRWGRGHRNLKRVKQNPKQDISTALKEGYDLVSSGKISEGVERVAKLNGLGLSFASKQLRFLSPSKVVILDSTIRASIGYSEKPRGYLEFLRDCQAVLTYAQKSPQLTPTYRAGLRVCDIEAAIFGKLKGY